MNGLSVIIPSRSAANLVPCMTAVRKHERGLRIIVIDDGIDWDAVPDSFLPEPDESKTALELIAECNIFGVPGVKPFIFARNCNLGIQAAGSDDVILLNDDALLESDGGFSAMQSAAALFPQFGLVSATTNLAGNPEQWRRPLIPGGPLRRCPKTPGNSFPTVAFVCVLIPRSTIVTVGLLDERFTAYGWEDNDYCRRVHGAGLHVGICDGCFVDHSKLHSTFRGDAYAAGDINAGRAIYLNKWGSM